MIWQSNHFYDVLEKIRYFFSIFRVISTSKPMKMAKTEFRVEFSQPSLCKSPEVFNSIYVTFSPGEFIFTIKKSMMIITILNNTFQSTTLILCIRVLNPPHE